MKLEIRKFKKHHDISVPIPSIVTGGNGEGKSTILEAFLWCMNQKDATLREFTAGNVYDNSDRDGNRWAEVAFHADGIIFRKSAKPLYSRERGTDDEKLRTELNCEYFINESPVKLAEYNAAIADTCKGYDLALFTNPQYFISLPQKEKLKIISSIVNVNIIDYICDLPNKAVLREEIRKQKEEIEELRLKSKSLQETFAEKPTIDRNTQRITALREQIKVLQDEERNAVKTEILQENQRLRELVANLEASKFVPAQPVTFRLEEPEQMKQLRELVKNPELARLEVTYRSKMSQVELYTDKIRELDKQRETVGSITTAATTKDDYICNVCPYCKDEECQEIQRNTNATDAADRIAKKLEELDATINHYKDKERELNKELEGLIEDGKLLRARDQVQNKEIAEENDRLVDENKLIAERNSQLNERNAHARETYARENQRINDENAAGLCKFEDEKAKQINVLKAKIITEFAGVDNSVAIATAEDAIRELEAEDKRSDEVAYGYATAGEQIQKNTDRENLVRSDLIANERLMIQIEQAEQDYRTECDTRINEFLPDGIEVVLFRKLITSDGFEEVAIVKIDGFENPNTSRANTRLSLLCQRFQEHYNIELPVFFDNAENCESKRMPLIANMVELRVVEEQPLQINGQPV